MKKKTFVLIVTGGSLEQKFLYDFLQDRKLCPENPYIIGVDKGLEVLEQLHIEPDLAIGDFDSAHDGIRAKYVSGSDAISCDRCIVLNPKKDYSDTHVAVQKALELSPRWITILGATGTRLDHTMANLGILKLILEAGVCGQILDAHNRITLIDSCWSRKREDMYGPYISLIPYSDRVQGVTLSGFVYDVKNMTMIKEESIGISNELREEEGLITIGDGYLFVMETKD